MVFSPKHIRSSGTRRNNNSQCFSQIIHLINRLYICDTAKDILCIKDSYIAKVELNISLYIPKEVASVEVANDLIKNIGFPPSSSLERSMMLHTTLLTSIEQLEFLERKSVLDLKGRLTRKILKPRVP